jgi:hypothetical protein
MNVGQWIVIGLSVVMGVWFGVGAFYNRRRGVATYRWLQEGLKGFGKISDAAWIGSSGSGARMVVGQADAPFRRIEVVFLLESREIMPLWIFNRFRDKQDEVILKAGLRTRPSEEIEVAQQKDRQSRYMITSEQKNPFEITQNPKGLLIGVRGLKDEDILEKLNGFLEKYGMAIKRISLQRKNPHLMVQANLPPLKSGSSVDFFQDLKEWLSR